MVSNEFFGVIAVLLTIASYVFYFRGIIYHGTVPHAVTWFCFGSFATIGFIGQMLGHGGAGAWSTGIGALCAYTIAAIGLARGGREIHRVDIYCLIAAGAAITIWKLCSDPLYAVITVSFADALALVPTLRKSWRKPHQETLATFALTSLRNGISLLALEERSLLTMLYPSVLTLSNFTFVVLILYARKLTRRSQAVRA